MSHTVFVSGSWFLHTKKVVFDSIPRSCEAMLDILSEHLQERIVKAFYLEHISNVLVEIDKSCLIDAFQTSHRRMEVHRSQTAQAAAKRHDSFPQEREDQIHMVHTFCRVHYRELAQVAALSLREESGSTITINVGGTLFTTSVDTLTRVSDSLLGGMFEGRLPVSRDSAGRVFIDRDPKVFKDLLAYLRDGSFQVPRDPCKTHRVLAEARYFQLSDLEVVLHGAWKEVLVVTTYSFHSDALVNTVHIDGPPAEIRRIRSHLNSLLGPEHFAYLLDGTVLTVNLNGAHGGIEMPSHGDMTSHLHTLEDMNGREKADRTWDSIGDLTGLVRKTSNSKLSEKSAADYQDVPRGCIVSRYTFRR